MVTTYLSCVIGVMECCNAKINNFVPLILGEKHLLYNLISENNRSKESMKENHHSNPTISICI